jgi:hypothetical protein
MQSSLDEIHDCSNFAFFISKSSLRVYVDIIVVKLDFVVHLVVIKVIYDHPWCIVISHISG